MKPKNKKAFRFIKRTIRFNSKSEPGVTYLTERHRDGNISCFCPGYVYRGTCRHVERAKNWK